MSLRAVFSVLAGVLMLPGAGLLSAGSASARNLNAGRHTNVIDVAGHVGKVNGFTPSMVRSLRAAATSRSSQHIAEFAILRSLGTKSLRVTWVPWKSRVSHGRMLFSFDPMHIPQRANGEVRVTPLTWLQLRAANGKQSLRRATSLRGLQKGMRLFIVGDAVAGGVNARVIAGTAGARIRPVTQASLRRAGSSRSPLRAHDQTSPQEFRGTGNSGFTDIFKYSKDLDVLIFSVGIASISLTHFEFTAAAAGTQYDYPFVFSQTCEGFPLLIPIEGLPTVIPCITSSEVGLRDDAGLSLRATPQQLPNGGETFRQQSGISFKLGIHIHTAVGCGTLGLESCGFDFSPGAALAVTTAGSNPAPTIPGQTVTVPYTSCPTIGLLAVPIVNWGLVLKLCREVEFTGAPLKATLSTTGGFLQDCSEPCVRDFNGRDDDIVFLQPTSTPVTLSMSNFSYSPKVASVFVPFFGLQLPGKTYGFDLFHVSETPYEFKGGMFGSSTQVFDILSPSPSSVSFKLPVGVVQGPSTSANAIAYVTRTESGGLSGAFQVSFTSSQPGQGRVLFGPSCAGLIETATQDQGAGTTNHFVTATGDDMNVGSGAVLPGATYFYAVQTITKNGVETEDNGGQCFSVTIPSS